MCTIRQGRSRGWADTSEGGARARARANFYDGCSFGRALARAMSCPCCPRGPCAMAAGRGTIVACLALRQRAVALPAHCFTACAQADLIDVRTCETKQHLFCTPRARTHTMTTPSAGRREGRMFFDQGQEGEAAAGLQGKKRKCHLTHHMKWVLGRACRRLLSSRDAY